MNSATVLWWIFSELAFGVTIGLGVSLLNEAFILASQIFGLQAGYGYASTVDPATQADSSVLQLFSNLAAGLLFFSLGFHRQIIRIFADSIKTHPPGSFAMDISSSQHLIQLGGDMFSIAVRLAIPVVA